MEEDFLDLNPFRRVRVWLDITKPLKRFQTVRLKTGTMMKVALKYERLPFFCFLCGLLSHTQKDCSLAVEDGHVPGWGSNIRASPRKGLGKLTEELNALKLKKNLFVPKPKLQ